MENNNLLDLNDDILNIIGEFVKKDNAKGIEKEMDFKDLDKSMDYLTPKPLL